MRPEIRKQRQEADALNNALVLFWPLWFVCAGVLAMTVKTTAWEPPLILVVLLASSPLVMLGVGWWMRGRNTDHSTTRITKNVLGVLITFGLLAGLSVASGAASPC